jgi:hypothetical protein
VGALSLWLLQVFKSDIYAILAIAGTYIGIFFMGKEFGDFGYVGIHLILWDMIFVSFGVVARNRSIISIAAYFALGIVAFYGLLSAPLSPDLAFQLAIIQLCQIMLTALATAACSIKHGEGLSEAEAIKLVPVFLFFYGLEYSYINIINPGVAPFFSLTFGAIILALYWLAKNRLQKAQLSSSSAIYSFIAILFAHSVYMVLLGTLGKLIVGLLVMALASQMKTKLRSPAWQGAALVGFFMIGWSILMILIRNDHLPDWQYLLFGLLYGIFLLAGHTRSTVSILLPIAHVMIVTSLCRLSDYIPELWIGPLCVAYAFGCLTFAWKRQDLVFAKAAFPIVFFAIWRFLFKTFPHFSQGERIISLLVMGALIYAGGFVYRKVKT